MSTAEKNGNASPRKQNDILTTLGRAVFQHNMSEREIEWLNERAAILQYDAGYTRPEAERLAIIMTLNRRAEK